MPNIPKAVYDPQEVAKDLKAYHGIDVEEELLPKDSIESLMDEVQQAYNQIQAQGLQPDTIIMHPDIWEQIKEVYGGQLPTSGISMGATAKQLEETVKEAVANNLEGLGVDVGDIVCEQSMTSPGQLLFHMNITPKYPVQNITVEFALDENGIKDVVLKSRWDDILDE